MGVSQGGGDGYVHGVSILETGVSGYGGVVMSRGRWVSQRGTTQLTPISTDT